MTTAVIDVKTVAADVVAQLEGDAVFAATIAKQLLGGDAPTFLLTIDDLLAVDEDSAVEFKSTARWNLNEQHRDKEMAGVFFVRANNSTRALQRPRWTSISSTAGLRVELPSIGWMTRVQALPREHVRRGLPTGGGPSVTTG